MLELSFWMIIKVFILIFLGIYVIFSLVVIKQISLMIQTIEIGFEKQLKLLGYLHFLFSVAVLVFGLLIL
jgi:hypothetical protein